MSKLFDLDTHPLFGKDVCLRAINDGTVHGRNGCANDQTGCWFNDGHNTCTHPTDCAPNKTYDQPLRRKEYKCTRCKKTGYNKLKGRKYFVMLGPDCLCRDCNWTLRVKYA